MKLDLKNDEEFDSRNFDKDNGQGAAQSVINELRNTKNINSPIVSLEHNANTFQAALDVDKNINVKTEIKTKENFVSVKLGLSDMKDYLKPKIDKVLNK